MTQNEEDKKTFIDAADKRKKEVDSDLSKFLNIAHGDTIEKHTYLTPHQIKSIRGLNIITKETGDQFFAEVAKDMENLQLSEYGKNRQGIERVFTGIYSPALSYRGQETENINGENGGVQQTKKTKKGILRRFF